ncbi:hypothetical protein [Paenibacillus sp. KR2-11]|uniref:hypothetical protein n=1 Tax=Paenibacillus sp. KR2-11 TaxID=3385500 RepID=UPI0038FC14CE
MFFVMVHSGEADKQVIYFFTVEDLIHEGFVDFNTKSITIKVKNSSCIYRKPGESNIQDLLDIIADRLEEAETLETKLIEEQLDIKATSDINTIYKGHRVYDGNVNPAFSRNLKSEYDELVSKFSFIKDKAAKHLNEISEYVVLVRQLVLETNPSSTSNYISEMVRTGKQAIESIEKAIEEPYEYNTSLVTELFKFYSKFYDPDLDYGI